MNRKGSLVRQGYFLLLLSTQAFAFQNTKNWDGFYSGADLGGVLSRFKMQTSVIPGGTYFNDTQDAPQLKDKYHNPSSLWHFRRAGWWAMSIKWILLSWAVK